MDKYYAKVSRVIDGDTFTIKDKNGNTKIIRILGIDTPEKKQEFGNIATEFTRNLIEGKTVFVVPVQLGRYGRLIAHIKLDGKAIAETLLNEGMCFASGHGHKYDQLFYALEQQARVRKVGIWKKYNENPALYRKRHKFKSFYNNPLFKKPTDEVKNKADIKLPPPRKGLLNQLVEIIDRWKYKEAYDEIEENKAKKERAAKIKEEEKVQTKDKKEDVKSEISYEGFINNLKKKIKP